VSLPGLLNQVLDIKGITSAAVVNGEGFIVEGASRNDKDLSFVGGVIASGMASSRVLAGLLGEGEIQQTMIEYEDGPVLLIPLGSNDEDGFVMVATLDSINTLGRARFQLRKLLPDIVAAVSA
jgi:uncharacterized protein